MIFLEKKDKFKKFKSLFKALKQTQENCCSLLWFNASSNYVSQLLALYPLSLLGWEDREESWEKVHAAG